MSKDVVLPSGVKVRLVAVPNMVVMAMTKLVKEPQIPVYRNDAKDRDEPNPLDPLYLRAIEDYKSALGDLTVQAYLANGVRVLTIPADKHELTSDQWAEGLRFIGIDVPESGLGRTVAWLKYHILEDADLMDILSGIAIAGGAVTEAQVQQAAESFRNPADGDSNITVFPPPTV